MDAGPRARRALASCRWMAQLPQLQTRSRMLPEWTFGSVPITAETLLEMLEAVHA